MMIDPPINKLLKKADSRYSLVVAIARRARQLTDEATKANKLEKSAEFPKPVISFDAKKAVTIAINEIYDDTIDCMRGDVVLRQE